MGIFDAIPVIGPFLGVIIPFLIVLAVVVFVHEYGHYIVGRWCGIHAEVFSIGFGKVLYSWTDKRGTRWQVAALPLGGFVKFVGDMDPASAGKPDDTLTEEQKAVAFHNARLPARAAAVAAGPVANFLMSIVIFTGLFMLGGQDSTDPVIAEIGPDASEEIGFMPGDRVLRLDGAEITEFAEITTALHKSNGRVLEATVERDGATEDILVQHIAPPRIDSITPGMAASGAGMLPGDRILKMDGEQVTSFYDLQLRTHDLEHHTEVIFEIDRGGDVLTIPVIPEIVDRAHPVTGEIVPQPTLGVRLDSSGGLQPEREPVPIYLAAWAGMVETWNIIANTVAYVGDMIFANADTSQLGGPIRIAELSGDSADAGIYPFLRLIAILSTSIGLINLMPIPVLDGGHLMFYAIEAIRGRPLAGSWMQIGAVIGLSLVLSLMVFATYNDIARFFAG